MFKYLAVAIVLAVGSCGRDVNHGVQKPTPDPIILESERYAVYSAVLKDMFVRDSTQRLVIKNKTGERFTDSGEQRWDYIESGLAPISRQTIDDFKQKNAQPSDIENKVTLSNKVTLISEAEVDKFFGEGGGWWKAFYQKYPNSPGLITFSNVGLNHEMTQALLYVGWQSDGLSGEGNYVLLSKSNGAWKVERKVMTWIS
jgi:hypothetical protein